MELCLCRGVRGDGAAGKGGLLSLCVHSSTVLSSKVSTFSVRMSAIVNEPISFALTTCFCHWQYFWSKFPLLLLGKYYLHFFFSQFGDCLGLPKVLIEMHCSQ